jgi:predicted Rossmann fold nucleotide-binding protein DprA/Smf involved in DNA uptake
MPKIGIVGSRGYNNYEEFKEKLLFLTSNIKEPITYISGGCKSGADKLCKQFCLEFGSKLIEHLPDWSQGKKGAIIRNKLIIADSDMLAAWWDGESRGTKSSIDFAEKRGIPVKIINI